MSHQEWLPTLLAAAGERKIVEKLKAGYDADGKHFRVHIDGFNALPYLSGDVDESPRGWFFHTSDDGLITAIRYGDWKAVFYEQRAKTMQLWAEPFVPLRLPKLFNLRRDPFERADESANMYWDWVLDHVFVIQPMQALAAEQLQSFVEFPPRQKPAAFNLDSIMVQLDDAAGGGLR
jgi:arylsulfatase A-like enzyme